VAQRSVLFQTQKEDKAKQLVRYAKCLYERQPQWLRDAYALAKPLRSQSELPFRARHRFSYELDLPAGLSRPLGIHAGIFQKLPMV
jgi:hypothetical protein